MKSIIILLLLVWALIPTIAYQHDRHEKLPTYKILSATSSKEMVKLAVIEEFGLHMASIVKCESGFKVNAFNKNKNGSVDRGIFQLNSVHDKKAKQMGIDVHSIEGQFEFARHLVKTQGYRPWVCHQIITNSRHIAVKG